MFTFHFPNRFFPFFLVRTSPLFPRALSLEDKASSSLKTRSPWVIAKQAKELHTVPLTYKVEFPLYFLYYHPAFFPPPLSGLLFLVLGMIDCDTQAPSLVSFMRVRLTTEETEFPFFFCFLFEDPYWHRAFTVILPHPRFL